MLNFSFGISVLAILLGLTSADNIQPDEVCVSACQYTLSSLTFNGTDPDAGYYESNCGNELRIKSMYLCSKLRCNPDDIQPGIDSLNSDCVTYGGISLPPYSIILDISQTTIDGLRRVSLADMAITDTLDEMVLPEDDLFDISFDTIGTWEFEINIHATYGWALYGFWAGVIIVGISYRALDYISKTRTHQAIRNVEDTAKLTRSARFGIDFRRHLIAPAAFGYHNAQPVGWCTIPARLQSLTIATFVLLNLIFCCVNYRVFEGNLYWTHINAQLVRYISDRTGILSFANLPLMFLFATRNNFLLWITGWSYATFNSFHRWVARVATLEAVVHGILYTYDEFLNGGSAEYYESFAEEYWYCGVMALVAMCFIIGLSIYGLRHHFYDLFLMLHIALSIIFLVGCYFHVKIFDGQYNIYIWPCIAVWAFDRVARIARVVMLNVTFWKTRATATYSSESNIIKLEISAPHNLVKPFPGAYYYVYVLQGWRLWENHPFTLAAFTPGKSTIQPSGAGDLGEITVATEGNFEKRSEAHPKEQATSTPSIVSDHDINTTLSFLIRPYNGFTCRLKDSIISGSSTSNTSCAKQYRVLLEGPYGESPPLNRFTQVLFVVGGVGVTSMLSHMSTLLDDKSSIPAKIHIVWSIKSMALANEVMYKELRLMLAKKKVTLDIYVTSNDMEAEKAFTSKNTVLPERVKVIYQRIDIQAVINNEAQELVGQESLVVVASGPGGLLDDSRRACVQVLKEKHNIEYFQDSFTW